QPIFGLGPVTSRVDRNLSGWRTINHLLLLFAALGLALAALGIYGIITRLVSQRTSEIGIRMALGAQLHDIMRLVLGGGLRTTMIGALIGIAGAIGLTRYLNSATPAFGGDGLLPIAAASVILLFVALLACWLPA